jgi:hypothetical protein
MVVQAEGEMVEAVGERAQAAARIAGDPFAFGLAPCPDLKVH